jgi:predicted hotdog family 3-hydroxylacyl-ACP dehydratase
MSDSLDALIPHRPPMQWIDALIECADTAAAATACFGPGDFPVAGGFVLETALVECVAQTAAAALGSRARGGGDPHRPAAGMLAAVRDFQIVERPPIGRPLRIEIRQLRQFGPMLLISGTVACDGRRIASGELTLYV